MGRLKEVSAAGITHFISGGGTLVTTVTAVCLSGVIVGCAGTLATLVRRTEAQMVQSVILSQLLPSILMPKKAQPAKTSTFLNYINALAPAVLNMELLPEKQLAAFQPLYNAAQTWEIVLQDFSYQEKGRRMSISFLADSQEVAQTFYDTLCEIDYFAEISLAENSLQSFTISFTFN